MFQDYVGEKLAESDCVVSTWQSPTGPYAIFKIVGFTQKMVKIQRIFPEPKAKVQVKRRYSNELVKVDCKSVLYKVLKEGM